MKNFPLLNILLIPRVSAALFGSDMSYQAANTTEGELVSMQDNAEILRLYAEPYDVMDLDVNDLPAGYNVSLSKRDWQYDVAYAVAGGAVAATGLAARGAEFDILKSRQWMFNDDFSKSHPEIWKRAQTVTTFQVCMKYAFEMAKGTFAGLCAGNAGEAAKNIGQAFVAGASPDAKEEKRDVVPSPKMRKGFVESWFDGARDHDELKKRVDTCNPSFKALMDTNGMINAWPAGATMKVTCKPYRDFGYCDQLDVAKKWIIEMINRGMTEGTFTVYNRQSATAHMRCSVAAREYFFNEHECPYEILGDQDGDKCINCPYRT